MRKEEGKIVVTFMEELLQKREAERKEERVCVMRICSCEDWDFVAARKDLNGAGGG